MQKIEVVVRITKDHCPPQEQTIFEWFDLMRSFEFDGTASGQTVYKGADL